MTTLETSAATDRPVDLAELPGRLPWQGTKGKQYEQVGNAIPPVLALHALSEATGIPITNSDEAAA